MDAEAATIESLVVKGITPPRLAAQELDRLDLHSAGILAVQEVLRSKPLANQDYRSLSRYASHVARLRLSSLPMLADLAKARIAYLESKKYLVIDFRKMYDEFLSAVAFGYKPATPARWVHIWFWDNEEMESVRSVLADTGLSDSFFYAFVAGALSEVGGIGAVAEDLSREYELAIRYAGCVNAAYQHAAESCLRLNDLTKKSALNVINLT